MRSLASVLVPLFFLLSLTIILAPVGADAAATGLPPWSAARDFSRATPAKRLIRMDNTYTQVANFALQNRAVVFKENLRLVEVVSGSTQDAGAGKSYRLVIRAADSRGNVGRYQTVVWAVLGSREWTWKVLSFQRVAGN
ncbi:hypothetical protein ACP4OV_021740 [Aristida adscensionis]